MAAAGGDGPGVRGMGRQGRLYPRAKHLMYGVAKQPADKKTRRGVAPGRGAAAGSGDAV